MTTFKPATNLNDLCLNELIEELFWLEEQPLTKKISNALDKCWEELQRRQDRIDRLMQIPASWD